MHLLAQTNFGPAGGGGFVGFGGLAKPNGTGIVNLSSFLTAAIGIITLIGIVWFVFTFIGGAIGILTSGGDKQVLETSKKKITTALIGLVMIITGLFVLDLIGYLLGVPLLNLIQLFGSTTTIIGGPPGFVP